MDRNGLAARATDDGGVTADKLGSNGDRAAGHKADDG